MLVRGQDAGLAANGSGAVPNGQGLTKLRDRVQALGGSLRVEGAPGLGTSVHAELPVTARDR